MRAELLELIDRIEEMEKLFHISGEVPGTTLIASEIIYDRQDFQVWLKDIQYELQKIYNRTRDHFIWETLNDLKANFNGWKDRERFDKIRGDLLTIKKHIDDYYPDGQMAAKQPGSDKMVRQLKIFISHSSHDIEYVREIVNLLREVGLRNDQIFCSSLPGYGIPLNMNIFDYLRELFQEYDLHVILVHSVNYYNSVISLNEMGAAWVLRKENTSILLPGFDFAAMTGVIDSKAISIKLDSTEDDVKNGLNQLRDMLCLEFEIKRDADILWEKNRDEFIRRINSLRVGTSIERAVDKDIVSREASELLQYAVQDKSAQIIVTDGVSAGKCIQAGGKTFSLSALGAREFSKWDDAFDELLHLGYIKALGRGHEIFQVTNKGFDYIEKKDK